MEILVYHYDLLHKYFQLVILCCFLPVAVLKGVSTSPGPDFMENPDMLGRSKRHTWQKIKGHCWERMKCSLQERSKSRSLQWKRGMSVDSRLLIKQIEARPALWSRDDKHYCYQQIVSKQWAEIALIHGVHESKVKSKWKALRDTSRQELKKNPEQSLWKYYLDMQFLKGQLKLAEDSKQAGIRGGSRRDNLRENRAGGCWSPHARKRAMDVQHDDDYHFLMSQLPEMRKLDPRQKLLLRIKMMELFYTEACPEEL